MKIIHTADLHLHSKIDGLPSEKAKIRREEVLHTFERLCSYAKDNSVKAVILAGDVFDTHKVPEKVLLRFFNAISNAKPVEFIFTYGNHDDDYDFLSKVNVPSNLKICLDEWKYFSYDYVTVSAITLTNLNSGVLYDTLSLDEDKINIVCMHGQVANYVSGTSNELISLPKLKDKNIDYLALGHIHAYSLEKLDNRGKYSYSGCLDGRGFDETGEKGFVLIDVTGKELSTQFIPFASRTLYTVEVDVSGEENWYSFANKVITELSVYNKNSLLKIVLKGERPVIFEIDVDYLVNRLNEEFFFAKVYDQTTLKIGEDDYKNDKSVRGEFVRAVLSSDLSEEEKNAIIMTGLNALKGGGV